MKENAIDYRVYSKALHDLEISDGFFAGWPNPPDKHVHRRILEESYKAVVAIDKEKNAIIGFINIISDGVLSAYLPLLEVIPSYRKRGIGAKLIKYALEETKDLYMIDLLCDEHLQSYYEKLGMIKARGMATRNYAKQNGKGS